MSAFAFGHELRTAALALAAAAALAGCGDGRGDAKAQAGPPPAPPVSVAAAIEKDVIETDEFPGRIEAIEQVEVRARVTGYIQSVHFKPGAEVKKGDLLFTIDPRPFEAEVAAAESHGRGHARAARSRAHRARTRNEALLADRATSKREFDDAVTRVRTLESQLRAQRGRARHRAAQSLVHAHHRADLRPREQGRDHRRQPGAGRDAERRRCSPPSCRPTRSTSRSRPTRARTSSTSRARSRAARCRWPSASPTRRASRTRAARLRRQPRRSARAARCGCARCSTTRTGASRRGCSRA